MAVAGTSAGRTGGARMLSQMRNAWVGIGGVALPISLQTGLSDFDENNLDPAWEKAANTFLDKALWWFNVIKYGKEANN